VTSQTCSQPVGRVLRSVGLAGGEFVIGVHCAKVVAFPRVDRVDVLAPDRTVEAVKHVISAPSDQSVVPHRAAQRVRVTTAYQPVGTVIAEECVTVRRSVDNLQVGQYILAERVA